MKIEIEVTEDEIRAALERKIRVAIADHTNQWWSDQYIKERVKNLWKESVDAIITEILNDAPKIREKIQSTIDAKLRAQITKILKEMK